jgi:transposase
VGSREWAKEGVTLDWQKFMPQQGFVVLPRRWVVQRMIAWIDQQRRMSKDYERLCASSEALVICCHDSPHDEAARRCLRAFHTVSKVEFCELRHARL